MKLHSKRWLADEINKSSFSKEFLKLNFWFPSFNILINTRKAIIYSINNLFYYRVQHIFYPVFSGCNHARLEMFCIIKNYCGAVYPLKIFLMKLTKSHFSSFIVRTLWKIVIVKDSVIIQYVKQLKWVFGVTLFGGGFHPLKTILGT